MKNLVLLEGAFATLLPPVKPGQGGLSLPALRKAVAARFEEGDKDGGLELFVDRDTPGRWKLLEDDDRRMFRDNAWTLIMPPGPGGAVTCSDLADLKIPVLLMQGEKTAPRFVSIVEATRKCLPSAQHVVIPEAAHSIQRTNPAGFQAALVKFLRN